MCVEVYLCSADPDDPRGRDDDGSVSSQRAALLYLLQHEARHLVVILKHRLRSADVNKHVKAELQHRTQRTLMLNSKFEYCLFLDFCD